MEKVTITPYESPQVEVVEIEVEQGFAVSIGGNPSGYTPDESNNDWLN